MEVCYNDEGRATHKITRSEVLTFLQMERQRVAAFYAELAPLVTMFENGTTTPEQDELVLRILNDDEARCTHIRALEQKLGFEDHPFLATIVRGWKYDENPMGFVITEETT